MTWALGICMGSLMLAASGEDPAVLVQQLGASRYADRQAAVQALETLGKEALPALREARQSPDAEVRARAVELTSRIEADLLVQATPVRLEFTDVPLPEVVAAIARQTGIPMTLVPENNPIWQNRRITLSEPEPVPFWKALDRLCAEGELRHAVAQNGAVPGRDSVVQLFAGAGVEELIAQDNGPFRITVEGIHYHIDRKFGRIAPAARAVQPGLRTVQTPGEGTSRQFFLDLQVISEPRMVISNSGLLKLIEAVDSNGHSLLPGDGSDAAGRAGNYFGSGPNNTMLPLQVHLRYPDQPGATIKRLRGTIPLLVAARKADPLEINLVDSKGKTFQTEDVAIQIHDVQNDPNQPRTSIELSIRNLKPEDPSLGGSRMGLEILALRSPNVPQSQIEILDAQGRPYRQWFPSASRIDPEEARMTLTLINNGEIGPPAQLRFYDLNRATTEVAFEFQDVPMP